MMIGGPGIMEILVIAVILVLIFGAKKLPGIGEGLGKTVKEFRNIKKEMAGKKSLEEKKKVEAKKAVDGKPSEGGTAGTSQEDDTGDDLADALQKKVTKKVADTVMSQVPGIKQAKQLKDKADKIKKLVS